MKPSKANYLPAIILVLSAAVLICFRLFVTLDPFEDFAEKSFTGGIARDIIRHGFRFDFAEYKPEFYENGIVIEGILAVPFLKIFGENVLSLVFLALSFHALTFALCFLMVNRLSRGSPFPLLLYCVLAIFPPHRYLYESYDYLGHHPDAVALNFILIFLFARWAGGRSRAGLFLLGALSGFFFFWHKGTLLAVASLAITSVFVELSADKDRNSVKRAVSAIRDLLLLTISFILGYSPGIALAGESEVKGLLQLFTRGTGTAVEVARVSTAREMGLKTWLFEIFPALSDGKPLLAIVYAVSTIGIVIVAILAIRKLKHEGDLPRFALFCALPVYGLLGFVGVAMLCDFGPGSPRFYLTYLYPALFLYSSITFHYLIEAAAAKCPKGKIPLCAAVLLLIVIASISPPVKWNYDRFDFLLNRTGDSYHTYWRFGQSFFKAHGDGRLVKKKCDMLEAPLNLECYMGYGASLPKNNMKNIAAECSIFGADGEKYCIYGIGKDIQTPMSGRESEQFIACANLPVPSNRHCLMGSLWNRATKGAVQAAGCRGENLPFTGALKLSFDGGFSGVPIEKYMELCRDRGLKDCGYVAGFCGAGDAVCDIADEKMKADCERVRNIFR